MQCPTKSLDIGYRKIATTYIRACKRQRVVHHQSSSLKASPAFLFRRSTSGSARLPGRLQSRSQDTQEREGAGSYYSQEAPSYNDYSGGQPPPPPPPPPPKKSSGRVPNFLGVFVLLMVGAVLWWKYIDSQMPQVYRDQDSGLQYVMTDGGHKVVVGEDKAGRVYFVDSNGNFYYDTGIPSLGFYMVTAENDVFNIFGDKSGERQTVYVGSMNDLQTLKIEQLGGIPVSQIKKALGKNFDGTITGFTKAAKPEEAPKISDFGGRKQPKALVEYGVGDVVIESKEK